ncbi:MAG: hypothetical protein PHX93_04435 [Candidatus Peribacteraceae bacterium]|jgi:hypothetical protein|nr:hypothetical protein [Candidatus Peribacteraceae bacterium]
MEALDAAERLCDDTVTGALARRKKFLGKGELNELENTQITASMVKVRGMTSARTIDKQTTETLFRQRYPAWKGVKEIIATATGDISLDDGLVVYRFSNGDWMEPIFGHWIPACFPWAQMLEKALRESREHRSVENGTLVPDLRKETTNAARATIH